MSQISLNVIISVKNFDDTLYSDSKKNSKDVKSQNLVD